MPTLEQRMRVADDTKKHFTYAKDAGKWAWCDRDEIDNPDAYHGGFNTFAEALEDATDLYFL